MISKYCTAIQNGYQLIWKYFGQIQIPNISDARKIAIEKCVCQILNAKKQNPNADTTETERQIDRLVYQLYEMTEEEIAIVEGR